MLVFLLGNMPLYYLPACCTLFLRCPLPQMQISSFLIKKNKKINSTFLFHLSQSLSNGLYFLLVYCTTCIILLFVVKCPSNSVTFKAERLSWVIIYPSSTYSFPADHRVFAPNTDIKSTPDIWGSKTRFAFSWFIKHFWKGVLFDVSTSGFKILSLLFPSMWIRSIAV